MREVCLLIYKNAKVKFMIRLHCYVMCNHDKNEHWIQFGVFLYRKKYVQTIEVKDFRADFILRGIWTPFSLIEVLSITFQTLLNQNL